MITVAGSGKRVHPGDCGHVTPVSRSGEGGHPDDCGNVTPGTRSGKEGVILETVDM